MNIYHGSFKEYEQACKLSCLGLSPDAIADVLGKDPRTIAVWLRAISKKANLFHDVICLSITLTVLFIQMDELWSYLKNKNNQLWVFVGFEVESRFWLNFEVMVWTPPLHNGIVMCQSERVNHHL